MLFSGFWQVGKRFAKLQGNLAICAQAARTVVLTSGRQFVPGRLGRDPAN